MKKDKKIKHICFFDIDGTLRPNSQEVIPQSALTAIEQAKAKGVAIYIATGRGYEPAQKYIEMVNPDGFIASNGQHVVAAGQTLVEDYFDEITAKEIIQSVTKITPMWGFKGTYGSRVLASDYAAETFQFLEQFGVQYLQIVDEINYQTISQVWAYGSKQQLDLVEATLAKNINFFRWNDSILEITSTTQGKAKGLEIIKNLYLAQGFITKTYAFGDGENDFEMMEFADVSVAMADSNQKLIEACDYVTATAEDDGIAKALAQLELC